MIDKKNLIGELMFGFIMLVILFTFMMWIMSYEIIRQGYENFYGNIVDYYGINLETIKRVIMFSVIGTPILIIPLHISAQKEIARGVKINEEKNKIDKR